MRKIPVIPICHAGLEVRDLPMPLSLRQGIAIDDPPGLERLYSRIAAVLSCSRPATSFDALAGELTGSTGGEQGRNHQALEQLDADRAIRHRLEQALNHPDYKWRSIESVAAEAGISEERAADLLRADDRVRFSVGKSGKRIVGWTSRIGTHR